MVEINGEVYYFYEDEDDARQGQMVVGWVETPNGSRYYFCEDEDDDRQGQMVVVWLK